MYQEDGTGKEYLKGKIEALLKVLLDKQQVGQEIKTFIRNEPPRKGWELTHNPQAGLFADKGSDLPKLDEEEEQYEKKGSDKDKDQDSLKANIKSKKAFSMAIND